MANGESKTDIQQTTLLNTDGGQQANTGNISTKPVIIFTIPQIATIISIILGSIGTIAYAIASFIQTRDTVNELKETNNTVSTQISNLQKITTKLEAQVDYILKDKSIATNKSIPEGN